MLLVISSQALPIFLLLVAFMAFLYASVGHGGASGYLAVLAFYSIDLETMRSSSLLLNIFVSFISFYHYYRSGYFRWRIFWPFALGSIPAAFVGAQIGVDAGFYKKVLGICLLFPVLRLLGFFGKERDETQDINIIYALSIGTIIGIFSGMIGIGGGILLSPIILLFHWAKMKETAAVSALFILVNSISGLTALLSNGYDPPFEVYYWLGAATIGGFIGAYFGSKKLNQIWIRYMLACVLLIASIKLILT